jgi:hypothetical protein
MLFPRNLRIADHVSQLHLSMQVVPWNANELISLFKILESRGASRFLDNQATPSLAGIFRQRKSCPAGPDSGDRIEVCRNRSCASTEWTPSTGTDCQLSEAGCDVVVADNTMRAEHPAARPTRQIGSNVGVCLVPTRVVWLALFCV